MGLKIGYPFEGKYPISFKYGEAPEWYLRAFGYPHNGVDFAMPIGVKVIACERGVISYADNIPDSNGKGINIAHEQGMSQNWHLSVINKRYGDMVEKGEEIGMSGDTGFVTGPHLHFGFKLPSLASQEMRGWVDPLPLFEEPITEPALPPTKPKKYTVKSGDTLWKISERFYGSGYHWQKIFDVNRDKIKAPALIYPFQEITIP